MKRAWLPLLFRPRSRLTRVNSEQLEHHHPVQAGACTLLKFHRREMQASTLGCRALSIVSCQRLPFLNPQEWAEWSRTDFLMAWVHIFGGSYRMHLHHTRLAFPIKFVTGKDFLLPKDLIALLLSFWRKHLGEYGRKHQLSEGGESSENSISLSLQRAAFLTNFFWGAKVVNGLEKRWNFLISCKVSVLSLSENALCREYQELI